MEKDKFSTVVIGAGQAGLAAGYFLKKINEDFIILDQEHQIGESWRQRWDSLRLFTPSEYDGLPNFQFPAIRGTFPTKDDMADYLFNYATKFSLPVELNTKVIELRKTVEGYEIITSKGSLYSDFVIVTTGTNPIAYIPEFAKELDKKIIQIHSSEYKNPMQFPAMTTLVVGAGTSGVQIAIELSKSRATMLSGSATPHIPDFIFRYAGRLYWWFACNVLTLNTPIGRKVRPKILSSGAPLISVSLVDVKKAKVEHLPRLKGTQNGLPQLDDDRIVSVESIVWATGYKPDFFWIKIDTTDDNGWPVTKRGVSEKSKGLYFIGMLFQFGLTSGLVGGVGRDAAFVVNHLLNQKKSKFNFIRPVT
jgi:putative flavoprotein involved in K+ transport